MNNLDKQYTDLLQDILDNGVTKQDRTGTGTLSVFGRTIRHDMKTGFPALTTKKIYFKGVVTELLWFLKGSTNIKYLVDNNCHIWDGDAYHNYLIEDAKILPNMSKEKMTELGFGLTQEEFINKIKTDDEFAKKFGQLGPIYGKQWRSWDAHNKWDTDPEQIDQIQNLINDLKTNPDSRRLMVSAWNPADLPHQVLPPCHYGFQVYTRELRLKERRKLAKYDSEFVSPMTVESWDRNNIPTRAISLMFNMRSCDAFLGLPFNIASYGLLLEIIAKEVNMVPDELIGNLGDTHLYLNHIEQAEEQIGRELTFEEKIQWVMSNTDVELENVYITEAAAALEKRTREPFPLPILRIKQHPMDEPSPLIKPQYWHPGDFVIENYQSHPAIKAPLSN
jgi:thymidylate synthase